MDLMLYFNLLVFEIITGSFNMTNSVSSVKSDRNMNLFSSLFSCMLSIKVFK